MEWFDDFRKTREALGLSQEQAAHELGITARTVARWEKGLTAKPRLRELKELKSLSGIKNRKKPKSRNA